jgi:DNA-binding XRE family transcriptional regulator
MKPKTLRAARGYFDFTMDEFAKETGISKHTIMRAEKGDVEMSPQTEKALQHYFASKGLEVTDNGIKEIVNPVITYEGSEGFIEFMTDVMNTALKNPTEICVSNVDESLWENNLPADFAEEYREKMKSARGLSSKVLLKSSDNFETASDFVEYRRIPEHLFYDEASFYAYGDKLGLITFRGGSVQIVVLHNKQFTDSFKVMFNTIWNNHKVIQ